MGAFAIFYIPEKELQKLRCLIEIKRLQGAPKGELSAKTTHVIP